MLLEFLSLIGPVLIQPEIPQDPPRSGALGGLHASRVPGSFGGRPQCVSDADRSEIERKLRSYQQHFGPLSRPGPDTTAPYPYYPMAGQLYVDLLPVNYVDLDPGSGIQDWGCGLLTYNGHDASDVVIRGFEEQDLGVPVFAVLDGTVVATHDGEFDKNTSWAGQPSNYVILDHGSGRRANYWHLRKNSVAVSVGQSVRAGEVIAMTGSSGSSAWPHLHFASFDSSAVYEPFAGPCRSGGSGWAQQVVAPTQTSVNDFAVSFEDPLVNGGPPWPLPRSGQIAVTDSFVYFWAFPLNLPAQSQWQLRFVQPDQVVAFDTGAQSFSNPDLLPWSWWAWGYDVPAMHSLTGTWHVELELNGSLQVRAPFEVRAQRTTGFNRPPHPVTVELEPRSPDPGQVIRCRTTTQADVDDPDFEVLRFRYLWTLDGVVVRDSTHAGQSDWLADPGLQLGQSVQCTVTPVDSRTSGPAGADAVLVGGGLDLRAPTPGLVGQINQLRLEQAPPGTRVFLAYSLQLGTTPINACPQLGLLLHQAIVFATVRTNALGEAQAQVSVPPKAAGMPLFLQAAAPKLCLKSALLEFAFR